MAITNATVVPIIIAARLVEAYRRRRVYAERVDLSWQGLLDAGGDRVRLNSPASQSVADYTSGSTLTYSGADVSALGDIIVNKYKSFAVTIDDINTVQSSADVLDAAVRDAGQALAEQVDADVRSAMVADATAGLAAFTLNHSTTNLSANSFKLANIQRLLDVAKLPRAGRWLIVGPYTAELIQKFALQNAVLAAPFNEQIRNGLIGRYGGLDIYVDSGENSGYSDSLNTAAETWCYGNDGAVAFVDQIRRVEQLRLETTFADAVRGLYAYGIKTVRSASLYKTVVSLTNIP